MNIELIKFFPDRTLQSIKSKRAAADYKKLVQNYIDELSSSQIPEEAPSEATFTDDSSSSPESLVVDEPASNNTNEANEKFYKEVIEYLQALPPSDSNNCNTTRLNQIVESLGIWTRDRIFVEISLYLRENFVRQSTERNKCGETPTRKRTKRQERKEQYAKVQKAWKKNRSRCIKDLLKSKRTDMAPPKERMIPFWETIMNSGGTSSPGVKPTERTYEELWSPITPREIKAAFPPNGTSPGPDGLSVRNLKKVPIGVWTKILNILMLVGKLPQHLLESRTTLIPKKDGAAEPGDFRPITVSSTITRTFHKVLANRLSINIPLDPRQKAFRPVDGCAENIFTMDFILKYTRRNFKPLYLATLDVAKAYDSVTHQTIMDTLITAGVPDLMIKYIREVYEHSTTRIQCNGWTSDEIKPTCGVKQGDPLSPILFNMVIDRLFSILPKEVGIRVGNQVVNVIGYADDLVLFATTKVGLQTILDASANYLHECGLHINSSKCSTVSVKTVPKEKKSCN